MIDLILRYIIHSLAFLIVIFIMQRRHEKDIEEITHKFQQYLELLEKTNERLLKKLNAALKKST